MDLPTITLNTNDNVPQNNAELTVIGFGDTNPGSPYVAPDRLHEVTVNYIPNNRCTQSAYPDRLINDASLCALDNREDACGGDSGGPLLRKGISDSHDLQVGVVSWYVYIDKKRQRFELLLQIVLDFC